MITRNVSPEDRAKLIAGEPIQYASADQLILDLAQDATMLDQRLTATLLAAATLATMLRPGLTIPEAIITVTATIEASLAEQQRRHSHEQN